MATPKDEMLTSNAAERNVERQRRARLGCCGVWLVLVAVIVALAWVNCAKAASWPVFVTTTGGRSMLPVLPEERIGIVVERCLFSDLKAGDIVIYRRADGGETTHALFRKMGPFWWAKGYGNRMPDNEYVRPDNFVGRVVARTDGVAIVRPR
jgi:signal peptidase I